MVKTGQYYLLDENPKKATEFANGALRAYPNSLDATVLHAECLLFLENYKAALVDFEKALNLFHQQFPDSYEAPEYLLDMLEYVRGRN